MNHQPSVFTRNLLARPAAFSAAVVGSALLAGSALFAATGSAPSSSASAPPDLKVEHAPVNRGCVPAGSFAPIVEKVAPSVVEVFVTGRVPRPERSAMGSGGLDQLPDQLRRFFEDHGAGGGRGNRMNLDAFGNNHKNDNDEDEAPRGGGGQRQRGLGSGVIVSADGYVLTNNHVVKDASEIRVALADGREFPATVVGTDPRTDLAVIRIKADGLPAVTFADSAQVAVGDVVLAVGNPFGIGQTVTQGIVSAKDRVTGGAPDEDYLQTDAAINPGNSGGALVDVEGRLVGINTAILSHGGGFQGVGFAVPSNLAQWVMNSLVKTGRVERGFLGVSIQNVTPDLVKAFKLDRVTGALVADVTAGSPAEQAGLKGGDVIREFNGQPVKDASQFKLQVAETAPGTKATVGVLRDGQTKTLDLTLAPQPAQKKLARNGDGGNADNDGKEALAGVGVADLDGNARAQAKVPGNVHGAVVTEVRPDSPAYEAGLRAGDVITEINRQPVKNAGDAVADTAKPTGDSTLVKVWRDGASRYVSVEEGRVG